MQERSVRCLQPTNREAVFAVNSLIDRHRAPSMKDFYASLDVSSLHREAISPANSLLSPS